ncbi:MAG: hypothetical protein JNK23_19095 [Opitutaceae bacterium]|nr:hypothetical protein [Opitutaceae bacterium]
MRSRGPNIVSLLVAGWLLGGGVVAHAQLASKSPFMPAQAGGAAAPAANAPIEYRGYLEIGGVRQFRLYDPEKKASVWVQLNERNTDLGVLAKEHDADAGTLTVEHRGTVHRLPIRVGKILAGSAPPPPMPATLPSNVAPAVVQSVVVNPTPADEQRRLESVAAEVARRRALREQATQTVNQAQSQTMNATPPAAPAPPQPAPQPR